MKADTGHPDPCLMRRVNEMYHDLQAEDFNSIHRSRHLAERAFWEHEVAPRLCDASARFGVDLCSGTGFVPQVLLGAAPGANMLCVDLSQRALEQARIALGPSAERARFHVGDVTAVPLEDQAADWVSINAGLHHVPEPQKIVREVDRLLRPGGFFCLGYEPNAAFFGSKAVHRLERLIWHACWYLSPARNVSRLRRRLGTGAPDYHTHEHLEQINQRLLNEGVISQALTMDELRMLVDVHSGAQDHQEEHAGFHPATLIGQLPGRYSVERMIFTDYGGESLRKHAWARFLYDGAMRILAPGKGQLFSLILRKPAPESEVSK